MGKEMTFWVRATPPSERFPNGVPAHKATGYYEDHELVEMRDLSRRIEEAEQGSKERAELLNELYVRHEAKVLLGATLVEEEGARKPEPEHEQTSMFEIPASVQHQLRMRETKHEPERDNASGKMAAAGEKADRESASPPPDPSTTTRADGIPVVGGGKVESPF